MDNNDKELELLRTKLEELYLRVRRGEACEDEVVKLSAVMDLLLVEKTRKINDGKKIKP
jgi:hypothetical protein